MKNVISMTERVAATRAVTAPPAWVPVRLSWTIDPKQAPPVAAWYVEAAAPAQRAAA
jgi:hypothetical protein